MDNVKAQRRDIPICKIIGFSEHQVLIYCPYCGQIHYHGKDGGSGHVVSHCLNPVPEDVGYMIPEFETYDPVEAVELEKFAKEAKRKASRIRMKEIR